MRRILEPMLAPLPSARLALATLAAAFGLLTTPATAAGPTEGGTAPHLTLRHGDPAAFDVRAPSLSKTTTEVSGPPLKMIIRNNAEGYRLQTDNPLPSSWVGDYTLRVNTVDADGTPAEREFTITYQPGAVEVVTAPAGEVWIPAVQYSFRNAARLNPLTTEQWKLPDGTVLSGTHELRVSVHPSSTVPVVVGGVRVNPGDVAVPIGNYDFTTASGKVSLPLAAAETGLEGEARLWITSSASKSPGIDLRVKVWAPHVALTSDAWTVRQAFDVAAVEVTPAAGNRCELTMSAVTARNSDMLTKPKCLVEWDVRPADLKPETSVNPRLKGRMWTNGPYQVGFKLSLVDVNDVRVPAGAGAATVTVTAINDLLSYDPARPSDVAYRLVQPIDTLTVQSAGPACDTYVAYGDYDFRSSDAIVRCTLTWTELPDALEQDVYWVRPRLIGTLKNLGTQTVGWKVDVITPLGVRIPAGTGSFDYSVIDPPVPEIVEDLMNEVKPGLFAASRDGAYAGNVLVKSANAVVHVAVDRGSETVEDSDYEASPWGMERTVTRRINAVPSPLWSETPWTVRTWYTAMPDLGNVATFRTLAVPNENVKPVLSVASDKVLDTEDLPVQVSIRDIYAQAAGYDATRMGEWKVRLVKYIDYRTTEPLTDFVAAAGGEASFTIPASTLTTGFLRLTAEAVVLSPVPEYQRSELAVRPLNLTILKGGAIEAGLLARRISGEAPLTTVFTAALDNRLDASALGEVVWSVSRDDGASWTTSAGEKFNKLRLVRTFPKGTYLVKATLKNKYSGAEFTTEAIEVIAFDVPQATLTGPENVFIGGTGHYGLALRYLGEDLPADKAAIEWSVDGGKTFEPGGPEFDVSRAEASNFVLVARARLLEAPADNPDAWREIRRRVNFVPVRPPMVRIVGPARVEYPKVADFRGVMGVPYRNMDVELRGWWTLPDGSRVDGPLLTWGPTAADLAADTVNLTFHAEIVGYDARNDEEKRVRVWEYVWPEFRLEVTRSSQYAPGDMTVRLRQLGRPIELDRPAYAWTLPGNAVLLEDTNPTLRVVRSETAGPYAFSTAVSDARGNAASGSTTVNMLAAPAYAMTLTTSQSNPYGRAPLDVSVRPNIQGGHPHDRILAINYLLNGRPAGTSGSFSRVRLGVGTHTIEARATTSMGWTFGASVPITVVPNQAPSCGVTVREWTSGWLYYADCTDADGRIVEYLWTLDGAPLVINSNRISVSRLNRDGPPLVTVSSRDDAGALSAPVSAEAPADGDGGTPPASQ